MVVPVIKNTDRESLHSINSKVRDFAVRAKSKKLRPDEIEGSTFTISNLGMFGITEFTSIINQPNSAILSVGAIVKKPVVVNDKIDVEDKPNEEVEEKTENTGLFASLFGKKEEVDCESLLKQMRDCVKEKDGTTMCKLEVEKWEKHCRENKDEGKDENKDENKDE